MKNTKKTSFLPAFQKGIRHETARLWLLLAFSALALAGLFSLPPVILRGPFFATLLPVEHIFAASLVAHVDLSVLVWMLSLAGMGCALLPGKPFPALERTPLYLACAGLALMAIAPFLSGEPLKNNYIPVLLNLPFFLGLALFGCGIFLQSGVALFRYKAASQSPVLFGLWSTAPITLIACLCFCLAARGLTPPVEGEYQEYYESLFWGGGHVLQFTYTTLAIAAWFWLAEAFKLPQILPAKWVYALFALQVLLVLPTPLFYLKDEVVWLFTRHMREAAGIVPGLAGLVIFISYLRAKKRPSLSEPALACLLLSILLMGYGGVLAFLIRGSNAIIPAHYHGSIVGITLACMGLVYHLLPGFGYGKAKGMGAKLQPFVYGLGQTAHISGLALMGGYGALRKAPGSTASIDTLLGKTLFFSGGAIAITGGFIFLMVVLNALRQRKD